MRPLIWTLSLLCAVPAFSKPSPPQVSTATVVLAGARPRGSLSELHERFAEAIADDARRAVLEAISRTTPQTTRDVTSLFDLFMRFPQGGAREAAMASLSRLNESNSGLEPAFIEYIKLPESEARIFGINGALHLRSLRALPLIRDIAEQRFGYQSPGESPVLSDKNAWWAQYEALSALAQWQGTQALPLLRSKAGEAPAVARLMAMYLWKGSLPDIIKWAGAGAAGAEKAREALTADVPLQALRETRPELLRILRDPKSARELRHQLAIKVGLSSTPEEIDALLTEQGAAKDPETRLTLGAALFASRSPKTIPWLKRLAAQDPEPKMRIGALLQLRLLLTAAEVRPLLEAAAAQDPDPENRQSAGDMLKAPDQP
jgi:hypothetical protein